MEREQWKEKRSENSEIKEDELLGFNHFQQAREKKRQMCRLEVEGERPDLFLFQFQSKKISLRTKQDLLFLDVTARPRQDVWVHTFPLTALTLYPIFPLSSQLTFSFCSCFSVVPSHSDEDKRLNLILRISQVISPALREHPVSQPVPPPLWERLSSQRND